jgi:hypothetical protein
MQRTRQNYARATGPSTPTAQLVTNGCHHPVEGNCTIPAIYKSPPESQPLAGHCANRVARDLRLRPGSGSATGAIYALWGAYGDLNSYFGMTTLLGAAIPSLSLPQITAI